jgi:isoleucyl-tRNA synthetase
LLSDLIRTDKERAQDVLIVSQAELAGSARARDEVCTYSSELLGGTITVAKARGAKCERCWKYDVAVGRDPEHPDVCSRCAAVLGARAAA